MDAVALPDERSLVPSRGQSGSAPVSISLWTPSVPTGWIARYRTARLIGTFTIMLPWHVLDVLYTLYDDYAIRRQRKLGYNPARPSSRRAPSSP